MNMNDNERSLLTENEILREENERLKEQWNDRQMRTLNAETEIQDLQARLSAAEEALRQQAIYNDSYADLQARLSAAEERAEYERERAGARAEKAARLEAELTQVRTAHVDVVSKTRDLQARLSVAEERWVALKAVLAEERQTRRRAEAVVEAAKNHRKQTGCTLNGEAERAVRQYEEGQALPHGHGGVLPSTRDVMYPREEGK